MMPTARWHHCSTGSSHAVLRLSQAYTCQSIVANCQLQVPLEIAVRETSDAGVPIVIAHPDSASAAVYRNIAERVAQKLAAGVASAVTAEDCHGVMC